jgi:hypothetical protein
MLLGMLKGFFGAMKTGQAKKSGRWFVPTDEELEIRLVPTQIWTVRRVGDSGQNTLRNILDGTQVQNNERIADGDTVQFSFGTPERILLQSPIVCTKNVSIVARVGMDAQTIIIDGSIDAMGQPNPKKGDL